MAVKRKKTGLTLVEMLVVLGIIALLVGMLIPALTAVKNKAKEVKQQAQFGAINLGLVAFKNDYGDYPPSDYPVTGTGTGGNYCGAQELAEALMGWDLLGFHPKSAWRADGLDINGSNTTYDPPKTRDIDNDDVPDTLKERKSPYIDSETANVFRLFFPAITKTEIQTSPGTGLFPADDNRKLQQKSGLSDRYVLCDVFSMTKVILPNGKLVSAGTPVLYYKANTSQKLINDIYKMRDNDAIVNLKQETGVGLAGTIDNFYDYIRDPKIETIPQPYRPDSYILISAGSDGIYGTPDDIRNFGN